MAGFALEGSHVLKIANKGNGAKKNVQKMTTPPPPKPLIGPGSH